MFNFDMSYWHIYLIGVFNLWNIANVSARVCFLPDSKDWEMSKTNYNVGENKLGCTCKEKSDVKLKDCEIAYQSGMYWHAILNIDGKDVQSFTYDLGLGSSTVTGKNFGLNSSDTLYNLGLSAISYGDIYQYDG